MSKEESLNTLHFLVSGPVHAGLGSISVAHYTFIEAILDHGHEVSILYRMDDESEFEEMFPFHTHERVHLYRYKGIDLPQSILEMLPNWLRLFSHRILADTIQLSVIKKCAKEVASKNSCDALLFLGAPSSFSIPGVATYCFPQSFPEIELQGLLSNFSLFSWKNRYGKIQLWKLYYWYRIRLDNKQFMKADAIFFLCDWLTELGKQKFPNKLVATLRFPFQFRTFTRENSRDKNTTPRLLCLGRIVPRKRIDLFIDALKILKEEGLEFHAMIVGDRNSFREYTTLIDTAVNEGVLEYVEEIPYKEVPALLNRTDILVQPSEVEPLGNSVIEALIAGCRVIIGPSNGTLPDKSPYAYWFSDYTASSLAATIKACLADTDPSHSEEEVLEYLSSLYSTTACYNSFIRVVKQVQEKKTLD